MSEVRANTISAANGTDPVTLTKQSAAKAWVHFDQTGTFGVEDSFNQSSMDDNGTGDATLNLTNNMGSAYYSFSACSGNGSTGTGTSFVAPRTSDPTASAIRMVGVNFQNTASDREFNGWSLHGDLA